MFVCGIVQSHKRECEILLVRAALGKRLNEAGGAEYLRRPLLALSFSYSCLSATIGSTRIARRAGM